MKLSFLLLISYFATPLIGWALNAFAFRRRLHWFLLFLLVCIAGYIILLVSVAAVDRELRRELHRHEIEGNSAEAARTMDALTSDTGRALAPITGMPITMIWVTINFVVIYGMDWIVRSILRAFGVIDTQIEGDPERVLDSPESTAPETGNPYQSPPGH